MRRVLRRSYLYMSVVVLLHPFSSLYAETPGEQQQRIVNQEQQRLRTEREALERQRRLNAPSVTAEKPVTASTKILLPQEANCYPIKNFTFVVPTQVLAQVQKRSGTTLPQDTFYFLSEHLQPVRGQCVGKEGMSVLVNALMLELIKRGYTTTRVGIEPDQNLASGTLRFSLLPGYLRQIRFDGKATANVRTAFPVRPGQILNLRDLEQGLEQLQRVGSFDVTMDMTPGDLPGETDVILKFVRRKPWRLALTLDDTGSESSGKNQGGINLSLDDPLGLNDTLSLSFTHDLQFDPNNRGTEGKNMNYAVPWGNWTFSASASQNNSYQTLPNTVFTKQISHSDNSSFDGKLSYMFYRDQVQKNNIEFRVGRKFSKSMLEIIPGGYQEFPQQYRNTTFAEWAWTHRRFLGTAKFDLNLSYRYGTPWLGAQDDLAMADRGLNENIRAGILHYNLKTVDATLNVPFPLFGQVAIYTITFHGQFTNTLQDGANMISIGNRYTIRGFDGAQTLAAEQGYYVRNEIQIPLGKSPHSIYLGLDGGKVFGPSVAYSNGWRYNGTQLAGAAIGLRGNLFKGFSYEAFVAAKLYSPQGFESDNPVVGFNLRQEF